MSEHACCAACNCRGYVYVDISAWGGDDWNPGAMRMRCQDCNKATPEEVVAWWAALKKHNPELYDDLKMDELL